MPKTLAIPVLTPDEDMGSNALHRHSSIDQFEDSALHIMRGGRAVPISWDKIDWIDCNCVHSHRVYSAPENGLDYAFPVGNCRVTTDTYAVVDEYGETVEQLPAWFGEGFYKKMVDRQVYVNSDTNSLGIRNINDLKIGLDYILADSTLQGEDFDFMA